MAKIKLGSAGVTAREIDQTGPVKLGPVGTPAGIIGTATKGPAFVPVTVGNISDFYAKFGGSDGTKFGVIAASEWLRNAQALTYLRVLGVGKGTKRSDDGTVDSAGFIVGENQPNGNWGPLVANPYANAGDYGRTYFLGSFLSASANLDDNLLVSGAASPTSQPYVLGVLMAPSGVVLTLSSSVDGTDSSTAGASAASAKGSPVGSVTLRDVQTNAPISQFVMLLNGHNGTSTYPSVITASFDRNAGGNYFATKFNTDPLKLQEAGHYLYTGWEMPGFVVTGSGVTTSGSVTGSYGNPGYSEPVAFLLSGSGGRNQSGTGLVNYENFVDRFSHASTPWVVSQKFGGKPTNLFKLHSLDDGAGVSSKYKFSIENITPSADPANLYGVFDLLVRDWNDTDTDRVILERYTGLSLDPSNDKYIAKVIGDTHTYYDFDRDEQAQKFVIEGNYPNTSNYVRVEVNPDVELGLVDPSALPMGFRGMYHLVTSGALATGSLDLAVTGSGVSSFDTLLKNAKQAPVPFNLSVYQGKKSGTSNKRQPDPSLYWGVAFQYPTLQSGDGTQLGKVLNTSVKSFSKFFPTALTGTNFVVGDNAGVADDPIFGVLDSDRFNSNLFTLENVSVLTESLSGLADSQKWADAVYLRDGATVTDASPRGLRVSDLTTQNRRYAKFSFFMQGGFDGVNIFDTNESQLNNVAVESDMQQTTRGQALGPNVKSYLKAIEVMKNVTNVDVQLLAIPGIRNQYVTNNAVVATEERFDAMYVLDIQNFDMVGSEVTSSVQNVSVTNTTTQFLNRAFNSSFASAYFPDVMMIDPTLGTAVQVPPSVAVLGALALNDSVGHPWFAPAGFTRGALPTVLEPSVKLSKLNQDVLYDANINPLVQFTTNPIAGTAPTGNVVVWGQKTLLQAASALDRVNVRRLLIEIRRQVRDIAQTILFEPNRAATLARFSAAVTPRLQRIQALAGLERFKVIIDSSTTTQADIENNTVRGKIYVQPTRTVEFVSLDFVVANNIQQ